jgi:hypothetical protein
LTGACGTLHGSHPPLSIAVVGHRYTPHTVSHAKHTTPIASRSLGYVLLSGFDRIPNGYPKLAALQAKEQEYMIVRRFRCLNARNLLLFQGELSVLELQLEALDAHLRDGNASDVLRSWPTFAADSKRRNLVMRTRKLLREYSQLHP